jgi:hypothetical protein
MTSMPTVVIHLAARPTKNTGRQTAEMKQGDSDLDVCAPARCGCSKEIKPKRTQPQPYA